MQRSIIRAVAIAAAACLTLTACSTSETRDTATGSDGKVELTFANWQWLEPGRGEALWNSMLKYQEKNPNVALKKLEITRADYEKTLQTQMGAGGGPDLLIVPPALLPELATAGLLTPLEDVSEKGDGHVEQETFDGERLAYTWEIVNFGFFWNKNLLAEAGVEPPTDMDGVIEAAEAITAATGKPGFAARHSLNEEQPWWADFTNWPYGFGGGWSKDGELTIDDPKNVEAVTAFKKLYDSGAMPVGDDASTFRSRFKNGEIGMMFDNASVLFTMLDGNEVLTPNDIGVAPLPFPTENSSLITNFVGVNRNSDHAEEAMDFIRWLASPAGQESSAQGLFPTLNATAATPSADIVAEHPWIEAYSEGAKTAKGSPVIAGFELETPQIKTMVMKAIEGVLINGDDPADALKRVQEAAEAL